MGLGLYIVRTILEQHREKITAASEDGVTTFSFTVQLAAEESPWEANLAAFSKRLYTTWVSRSLSPSTITGSSGISTSTSSPRLVIFFSMLTSTRRMDSERSKGVFWIPCRGPNSSAGSLSPISPMS